MVISMCHSVMDGSDMVQTELSLISAKTKSSILVKISQNLNTIYLGLPPIILCQLQVLIRQFQKLPMLHYRRTSGTHNLPEKAYPQITRGTRSRLENTYPHRTRGIHSRPENAYPYRT